MYPALPVAVNMHLTSIKILILNSYFKILTFCCRQHDGFEICMQCERIDLRYRNNSYLKLRGRTKDAWFTRIEIIAGF